MAARLTCHAGHGSWFQRRRPLQVTWYVANEILRQDAAKARAQVITHFIKLAVVCLQHH
jgi:hypothetical protein